MNVADVVAALDFPVSAHVDQRVAKKLLTENGAPTAIDKRRINDSIEDVRWVAALKPTTISVPSFRDGTREYLEIAVLTAVFRPGAQTDRLAELIHRAVPYPVFMIAAHGDSVAISLAHKRWSLGKSGHTVLDGFIVAAKLDTGIDPTIAIPFVESLPLSRQPRDNVYVLYQGWIDTLIALLAARVTGAFRLPASAEQAEVRRNALAECGRLDERMARLRTAAEREKQLARQVALNLELKLMQVEYSTAIAKL